MRCIAWHTPHLHRAPQMCSCDHCSKQARTSRHLVSKLPYIQIQLSVDVDGLWRLTPCCSSYLEAVWKVLLPIDSRLHPIWHIQKALPCSDFLTSILQAMLNAADHTEQDSTHLQVLTAKSVLLYPQGWVQMAAIYEQAWKPCASTGFYQCWHMASMFLLPCLGMSALGLKSQRAACAIKHGCREGSWPHAPSGRRSRG